MPEPRHLQIFRETNNRCRNICRASLKLKYLSYFVFCDFKAVVKPRANPYSFIEIIIQ